MAYYSTIKKNKIMLFAEEKMDRTEIIMLSEINWIQRQIAHVFPHMQSLNEKKTDIKVEGRLFGKRKGTSKEGGEKDRVMEGEYDQSTLWACRRFL
jgi:hypothetical protein